MGRCGPVCCFWVGLSGFEYGVVLVINSSQTLPKLSLLAISCRCGFVTLHLLLAWNQRCASTSAGPPSAHITSHKDEMTPPGSGGISLTYRSDFPEACDAFPTNITSSVLGMSQGARVNESSMI